MRATTNTLAADAIVLGIDGGGTHTRAALVTGAGRVLGYGEAGPSNLHVVGRDAAREAIAAAVASASDSAGLASTHVVAAFLGIAGVATGRDRDEMRAIARELDLAPEETLGVDHDLRIALAGGLGGEPGIVLIAGTGSSCYGRTADGSSWRSGGWGPLLDDVGGGYWLAVRALSAIARAIDGRGASTLLAERLAEALALAAPDELLRMTGRSGLARDELARLAPLVLAADADGDDVAHEIVRAGVDELARMVQAVAQNLGLISESVPLVFSGGLASDQSYRNQLELVIARRAPNVVLASSRLSPVLGAALLALESAGALSREVVDAMAGG